MVDGLPKVTGSGREPDKIYISPATDKVLIESEKQAKRLGDSYVSTEHIVLAMFEKDTPALKEIFREIGLDKNRFLSALQTIRNNRRVRIRLKNLWQTMLMTLPMVQDQLSVIFSVRLKP